MKKAQPVKLLMFGLALLATVNASAEEKASTITSTLNGTTISGYVDSTTVWTEPGGESTSDRLGQFPSGAEGEAVFEVFDAPKTLGLQSDVSVVPEPSSVALLLAGAGVLIFSFAKKESVSVRGYCQPSPLQ